MIPFLENRFSSKTTARNLIAAAVGIGGLLFIKDWILQGAFGQLGMPVLGIVAGWIAIVTLTDWRRGLHLFLVWLIFEDLARKYLGNNMMVYFGKDALVAIVFVAFFSARKRLREPLFRPPFWLPLMLFFWLALAQVFNPNSPSIFYGLLGLKLYFCYVPLMFLGYALVRTEKELYQFLAFNVALGAFVCSLGIAQSILGQNFLNPQTIAPELRALSQVTRESPITHQMLTSPSSVFVSAGRFDFYIILIFIIGLGLAAYELLKPLGQKGKIVLLSVGIIFCAALMSGSRGAIVYSTGSGLIMIAAMLRGGPLTIRGRTRLLKALRRSVLVVAAAIIVMAALFPEAVGSRWAFYYETLDPASPYSELVARTRDYPIANLQQVFGYSYWTTGYGTGTGSLGVQYISRFLGSPLPNARGVESGIGALLLEFGIPGPFLWLMWTVALLIAGWRVVRRLVRTRLFPVAFSILWYQFLLLLPFTYGGTAAYQNFIMNVYFWLLTGVLFRLPSLLTSSSQETAYLSLPIPPAWRSQVRRT